MVKTKENKKCKAAYPFFHQKNIKKKEKKIKKKKRRRRKEVSWSALSNPMFPSSNKKPHLTFITSR
jgi:hypothetical protein